MKRVFALLLVMALASIIVTNTVAGESGAPVKYSVSIRQSLATADKFLVFEGLPNKEMQKDLHQKESAKKDLLTVGEYEFYSPAAQVADATAFKTILGDAKSIDVYRPKFCGTFHPDYCISWRSGKTVYFALICFTCGEIKFQKGTTVLHYDLSADARQALKTGLEGYAKSRPAKMQDEIDIQNR